MNYQVLARKWRPKKFSDIIGQRHIIQAITHSFELNKIHHAYILSGTRGIGKTTIARLLAKGLNCETGLTPIICGQCNNCKDIESGCFIDLIEIDAASRTKVEDTKEFLDNVQYMPSRGRFKIYLIDEVHMLSRHSFNALLKTLEEPPVHVKFILITTEHQKLPETILSRCLQFYLKPLNASQIVTQLTYIFNKENIIIESTSALESLAHASKGSMRDALSLAEQAIVLGNNNITDRVINSMLGILNIEHPLCLIESLIRSDVHNIMHQIDNYAVLGINWDALLSEMLAILQQIAKNQFILNFKKKESDNANIPQHINQRILKLSNCITPENIQLYYQILLLGRRELPYAPNYRIGVEMIMLRALAFQPDIDMNTINKNNNTSSSDTSCIKNNSDLDVHSQKHTITDINNHSTFCNKNNNMLSIKKPEKIHEILQLNFKKIEHDCNTTTPNSSCISIPNMNVTDITATILKARSELLQHKENNKLNVTQKSNLALNTQKTIKNILERFANINTNVLKSNSDYINIKNKSTYTKTNNITSFFKKNKNMISFVKEILKRAIKNDVWISQIYQLSLPKSAKRLVMHSWKETISSDEICLHVRPNYQYLNSTALHDIIQKSLSNNMGIPIKLYVKKDENYQIKTPMEYIYILYKEKISKLNHTFSDDPYVKLIKNFFDAEIDINDTKII